MRYDVEYHPAPSRRRACITEQLTNWGRAMRCGTSRGRAMSVEGQYRSPQSGHWRLPPSTFRGRADIQDAWHVEIAWSSLPLFDRIILRGHYCALWSPPHICRIAAAQTGRRCHQGQYRMMQTSAEALIAVALERTDEQNRIIVRTQLREMLDTAEETALNVD